MACGTGWFVFQGQVLDDLALGTFAKAAVAGKSEVLPIVKNGDPNCYEIESGYWMLARIRFVADIRASHDGHRTAYLWEKVWARESWLEILGRYLVIVRDKKKQITEYVFPRFHQLDVTRKLLSAVLQDGPGGKYLIQHSAGSGKTKSIAWTAHFLAELHDAQSKKVFDTVLVVSDRTVIDSQLQEALFDFQRTSGVVATITGNDGSKSKELAEALDGDKKIVVCTIQTFPFALDAVRKLAATKGKRFAVIADEAHSSQTGEAAAKLKAVLTPEELAELNDGGEVSMDDVLAAEMTARAEDRGITFVAFTATPKNKTIEIFGTRPDPKRKPAKDNVPFPFHVYSMRQAIEEKFILDVLKNYTPYKLAFKLAHNGKDCDEKTVERAAAMKGIMGWVRLHPYNIAQKVEVVVEHFREFISPLLNGRAKALLCGMFVDKLLAGIQAVQTLSRLNRAHPGKDTTYVVDFVNDPAEVLASFKTYHTTAELSATTDPDLVYNLRSKLDAAGHYDDYEVDRVVAVELKPDATQAELLKALEPVVDRLMKDFKAAQTALKLAREKQDETAIQTAQDELNALILFKSDLGAFIRLYTFLSQIFDYANTALEKRAIFFKRLLPLLEFGREREGIDLSKVVLTHHM